MMIKSYSIFLFAFLLTGSFFSQLTLADTSQTIIDSTLEEISKTKEEIEQELFQKELQDSIERIKLMMEAEQLGKKDSIRQKAIQLTLDSIKKNEELRKTQMRAKYDSLRLTNKGIPVIINKTDTLFRVYTKMGALSAKERVNNIERKLNLIGEKAKIDSTDLHIINNENTSDLIYEDLIILSISEEDAFWNGKDRKTLVNEFRIIVFEAVQRLQESNSIIYAIKRIIYLCLIIVGFFFLIKYLNKGFTSLNKHLVKRSTKLFNGLKLKNYQLITAEKQELVIKYVLRVIKWILIVVIVYLSLPLVLSIFPSTKTIAYTLLGYVTDPLYSLGKSVVGFIPNLFFIIVIILVSRLIVRGLKFFASEIQQGNLVINGFYPDWAKPTLNLVKIIVYALTFVMIFPYLPGSESDVFKGVSVFLGVLFSLGSSSAIGNIVAGLVITYMRAFRVGDRIKIGDVTGDVIEKTLLVTRVKTIKNEEVTIPNATILNSSTTNFSSKSKEEGIILYSTVTIGYDVDWRLVHELLEKAVEGVEGADLTKKPYVLQTSLDDFYVSYQINFYSHEPNKMAKMYSQLHANIQDQFNEAGIEILSPHYRAARDGNQMAVPAQHLPKDYKAPAFKVKKEE